MKYPIEISYTLDKSKHRVTVAEMDTVRSWTFDVEALKHELSDLNPDEQEACDAARKLLSTLDFHKSMYDYHLTPDMTVSGRCIGKEAGIRDFMIRGPSSAYFFDTKAPPSVNESHIEEKP